MRDESLYRRRRTVAATLLAAALVATGAVVAGNCSAEDRPLAPAAGSGDGRYDPLAFRDDRREEFERRAAAGLAQVLYAKSPGGIVASARRTARWRGSIERAARRGGVSPDLLEAVVLLESAGRPDAIAGGDPEGAAGLTQIVAGTATQLLRMRVDLAQTRELTAAISVADGRGEQRRAGRLRARRRRVDERFEPPRALAGAVRYLSLANDRFGRWDLALASYHMGIGNLEATLRAYGAEGDGDVSYARLYFDSTPLRHQPAYAKLAAFGDDSATYLWRVLAAREVMRLYRERRGELERLARLHRASRSAERVLQPRRAPAGGLVEPPKRLAAFGLALTGPRRALRPEALSAALYIGAGTKDIAGAGRLVVTDVAGYAFGVVRRYRSRRQALAFEFMLTRLQALNLIAWRRDGGRVRVVVAGDADRLLPPPRRLVRDRER